MTSTTSVSVSSAVMSAILSEMSLSPLRSRFALLPFLNTSSLDGVGAFSRTIPKRIKIADAPADTEDVNFSSYQEQTFDTPVTLTPTGYAQGVRPTTKALRRTMPGATRAQVIAAVERDDVRVIPILAQIAEELIQSHYRTAESAALALFSSLVSSAGTTATALSTSVLVDAQTVLFENKPEHRTIAAFFDAKGIGDLRKEALATGNSTLYGSGFGQEFLNSLGIPAPMGTATLGAPVITQPWANLLGMPIFEADRDMMATANSAVDLVGSIVCVGKGETAGVSSMNGFAEFCEGHALDVDLFFDLEADATKAIGRYEWATGITRNEHGVKVIYKKV